MPFLTDGDINKQLSRGEMTLHCRRRTLGEETTIRLLEEMLGLLMGSRGNDSFGVSLYDSERMEHILCVQRKHVKCIQDPPGVALYIKTGELTKGGVRLPVYRCARVFSSTAQPLHTSYSGDLLHFVNDNYQKLFGRKVVPEFCPPSRYTDLIGMQYLFRQTGQALQDMHPDS
ncbi:unnamed protein product [Pleuronectes platessa]|uniref:Uncharacterized protein n=1 Tax=Pleuronectes platessa TaxID=8262 RepID=A0A9N7UT73_PLEPL|nr:unnamed protein product [Pleuronectes platessa]